MSSSPPRHLIAPEARARLRRLIDRARAFEDDSDPWLRGLIATRVYRDQPDLPVVRKRAEILARTLEQLAPTILPEERIIGCVFRRWRVHPGVSDPDAWRNRAHFPEFHGYGEAWPAPEEVKRELAWWQGRRNGVWGRNRSRGANRWLGKYRIANPHGVLGGHTLPDLSILLENGIAELRDRIAEQLEKAPPAKHDEYAAMDRCLGGVSVHCHSLAAAARRTAESVQDSACRAQLLSSADACEHIAARKPETFAQALQLLYVGNFADIVDDPGDAASFGRIDQMLLPFYEADSSVSPEEAFELVCHFVIKNWKCQPSNNMTVGGQKADGSDATNRLSYMFLEAMEAAELPVDLTARWHGGCPAAFFDTVARVVRLGYGRPSIYNDDVTVPALIDHGIEPEDARDYAPLGCAEVMIPGRSAARTMGFGMNLPKVLELVLNAGRCLVTDDVVWDDVPGEYASFEELTAEYHRRVKAVVETGMEIIREDERIEHTVLPRPWLTVLSHGGIESGVDMTAGQPKYDPVGVTLQGVADIANSLYAVEHLVFDARKVTLRELREILKADWQGQEPLRQYVINRLPRFGQDSPDINRIAREEARFYAACFRAGRTAYGGRFWPMIFGVSTTLLHHTSPATGATPSGQRRDEVLTHSLQPNPAGPQGCITERLRSAASIDFGQFPGGISNVQEFDPSLFQGDDGLERLEDVIRGFFQLGGTELAPNFLDEAKLRDAQKDPDRHRHLMVRLFGLSAQFVNLSPELQETVIRRVAAASRGR